MGRFTAPNGRVVVLHEIGTSAGIWARRDNTTTSFRESVVDGVRVWVAKRSWPGGPESRIALFAVTFPDSDCASFYLESSEQEDGKVIDTVARSFHPKKAAAAGGQCTKMDK
ncbi:MAG: hypothetical protein QM757_05565 [Paludibaculum sp.]